MEQTHNFFFDLSAKEKSPNRNLYDRIKREQLMRLNLKSLCVVHHFIINMGKELEMGVFEASQLKS